jgi:hypothetical protein
MDCPDRYEDQENCFSEGKVVPFQAMKAHRGKRGTVPLIFKFGLMDVSCKLHSTDALAPEKKTILIDYEA